MHDARHGRSTIITAAATATRTATIIAIVGTYIDRALIVQLLMVTIIRGWSTSDPRYRQ